MYGSPFRKFLKPVSAMRKGDKLYALILVEPMGDYPTDRKGQAIIPVLMYADIDTAKKARKLTEQDVRDRFVYHRAAGRNKVVRVLGVYALRGKRARVAQMAKLKRSAKWKRAARLKREREG